jgi:hypothetical protein
MLFSYQQKNIVCIHQTNAFFYFFGENQKKKAGRLRLPSKSTPLA